MTNPGRAGEWKKASASAEGQDCVEVRLGRKVGVRDTKDRKGGQLLITDYAWTSFTEKIGKE